MAEEKPDTSVNNDCINEFTHSQLLTTPESTPYVRPNLAGLDCRVPFQWPLMGYQPLLNPAQPLNVASPSILIPPSLLPLQMPPLPRSSDYSSLSTSSEQEQSLQTTTAHTSSKDTLLFSRSASDSQPECFIKEEDEVRILEILRKEVPNSLQFKDLADISRRLQEIGLVPQEVKNNMDIMHSSVLHESRCRYLMVHVCQSIKSVRKEDKIRRLIMLCRVLCSNVALSHIGKHINNVITMMVKGNQVISGEAVTVTYLNPESHLGRLCDLLSSDAYKWEHLGIAFHLSPSEIGMIKSGNADDVLRLHSVLNTWLSGTSRSDMTPTLDNLRKALRSTTVNLGRLASKVEDILDTDFIDINMKDQDNDIQMESQNSENPIFFQVSSDVSIKETDEAAAILLEVFVLHSESSTTPYNWYKNKKPLNIPFPILCVKIKNITAEGSYYCSYNLQGNEYHSRPIQVHVETLLDNYKALLVSRYCSQPEVEPDSWPHVSQNTYINLAVVGNESSYVPDGYHETIRGDADDVFRSKSSVNYNEILEKIVYGNRVIIVGRPGSGKTTLVHRISQDWAKGTLLGKVKSLFLVSLRNFRGSPSIGLIELIMCCFDNAEDAKIVCDYIEKHQGLGVCFILDGLDEYQPPQTQIYYIDRLIKGQALPQAIVIVASRPAATDKYRINRINLTIEVLGFFKEQIKEYIESYHFKDKNKCSALQEYLADHVNVYRMCYLPIQTAMICFLYDVSGDSLPDRESKIYYDFTVHTIIRSFSRFSDDVKILTLDSLDRINKDTFFQICKLAFKKSIKSEQVIHEDENIKESLGLITVDRKATRHGRQKTYSFCHLTFQEFLAAFHISRQEVQEQLAIIQTYGPMKHMYMVFKFFCGLAQFEEKDIRFKTLIDVAKFSTLHTLQCCFESQQSDTCDLVAKRNIISIDSNFRTPSDYTCLGYVVMNARNNPVRIIECFVMGMLNSECIETYNNATKNAEDAHRPVALWVLIDDSEGDRNLVVIEVCPSLLEQRYIDKQLSLYNPIIYLQGLLSNKYIDLFYSVHHSEVSSHINNTFQKAQMLVILYALKCDTSCHSICMCTNLIIFNCSLNNNGAALLAEGLQYNSTVEVLKLVANDIGDEGAIAIASSIEGCSRLHYLDLCLNKIKDDGATALVNSMRSNFSLLLFGNYISNTLMAQLESKNSKELFQTLDITDSIGDKGLARLNSRLKELSLPNSALETQQTLFLESCRNDVDGTREEPNISSRFTCLYSLSLVKINTGGESLKILVNLLLWRHVHILNLSHNSIGPEGTTHLCQALQGISHQILTLNLGHNDIGVEGALAVAECLQVSQSLCELDLSYNDIQDTGTEAICESLKHGDKLQVLNLASNSIDVMGCFTMAILLEENGKSLICLDLSCNRLNDIGLVRLARGLRYCYNLRKLYLKNNRIEDIGVEAIAEVLKNTDLTELILEYNFINNEGAKALACGLHTCNKLTTLNLSNNVIGDVGAGSLGEGLSYCSRLHTLELNCNSISGSGAVSVAEGVRHCHDLNTLELGGNYIIESDLRLLAMTLKDLKELQYLNVFTELRHLYDNPLDEEIYDFMKYLPKCTIYGTVERDID